MEWEALQNQNTEFRLRFWLRSRAYKWNDVICSRLTESNSGQEQACEDTWRPCQVFSETQLQIGLWEMLFMSNEKGFQGNLGLRNPPTTHARNWVSVRESGCEEQNSGGVNGDQHDSSPSTQQLGKGKTWSGTCWNSGHEKALNRNLSWYYLLSILKPNPKAICNWFTAFL